MRVIFDLGNTLCLATWIRATRSDHIDPGMRLERVWEGFDAVGVAFAAPGSGLVGTRQPRRNSVYWNVPTRGILENVNFAPDLLQIRCPTDTKNKAPEVPKAASEPED